MVTKISSKKPTEIRILPVQLNAEDKQEILMALGIDEQDFEQNDKIIEQLEFILTGASNGLRRLPSRPMPAHIAKNLTEIAETSKTLADLMTQATRMPDIRNFLGSGIETGMYAVALTNLSNSAQAGIKRIKDSGLRSDGGARKANKKKVVSGIREGLTNFFRGNSFGIAADAQAACLQDFIETCEKYYLFQRDN
jgi:hypothetical protein